MRKIYSQGVLFLTLILTFSCLKFPFLHIEQPEPNSVYVDIATLTEYPTTVAGISIKDLKTNKVIWQVEGNSSPYPV